MRPPRNPRSSVLTFLVLSLSVTFATAEPYTFFSPIDRAAFTVRALTATEYGTGGYASRFHGLVGVRFDPSCDDAVRNEVSRLVRQINPLISPGAFLTLGPVGPRDSILTLYQGPYGSPGETAFARGSGFTHTPNCLGSFFIFGSRIASARVWILRSPTTDATRATLAQELTQALGPLGDNPSGGLWRDADPTPWLSAAEEWVLRFLYSKLEGGESASTIYKLAIEG